MRFFGAFQDAVLCELKRIADSLKEHAQSDTKNKQATEPKQDVEPLYTDAILDISKSIRSSYRAAAKSEERHQCRNLIVGIAGVLAVVAYTVVNACMLRSMSATYTEIKQQTAIAQTRERPWITVKVEQTTNSDGTLRYTFTFTNIGGTPTHGIDMDAEMVPRKNGRMTEDAICQKLRDENRDNPSSFNQFTILPGDEFAHSKMPSGQDFDSFKVADLGKIKDPDINGCVVYGTRFDNQLHYTQFWVVLFPLTGKIDHYYITRTD